jgi:hypothetical protein
MKTSGDPSQPYGGDRKQQMDALVGIVQIAAFPIIVWTTRWGTWGTRFLNMGSVIGLFSPVVFAAFYGPHRRTPDLMMFWLITVGLLLAHRIAGLIRRNLWGYDCYSRFWGHSWRERNSELGAQRKARGKDSALAFFIGIVAFVLGSMPLGAFIMISSIAKALADSLEQMATEARLRQMQDARLENEFYADLYRQRYR